MKKIIYSLVILVALAGILQPTDYVVAQTGTTECFNGLGQPVACPTLDPLGTGNNKPQVDVQDAERSKNGYAMWNIMKEVLGEAILLLGGYMVYAAGGLMNFAVWETVLNMSAFIGTAGSGIDTGWRAFRDLANILFIFILIYISVKTILSLPGRADRQTLVKIVVIALIINFSLFFTKVIIDTSNVVAIQFYNATGVPASANKAQNINSGISGLFAKGLFLQSFFDVNSPTLTLKGGLTKNPNFFTIAIMGFLFMIIASFVFVAAAILLVIRLAILIFLMITSPIAYVGAILPKGSEVSSKWWKALLDQCIFAPVFMMMLWVTNEILKSVAYSSTFGAMSNAGSSFVLSTVSANVADLGVVFNFTIVIVFLVASLVVAQKTGAAGGSFATNWAGKASFGLAAFTGRQTVGRGFNRLAQSEGFQRWAGRSYIGELALKGTRRVGSSNFDLRSTGIGRAIGEKVGPIGQPQQGGFQRTFEEATARKVQFGQSLRIPEARSQYAQRQLAIFPPGSARSIFGAIGRSNRVAAAQILANRYTAVEGEMRGFQGRLDRLNAEQRRIQNLGLAATPIEVQRLNDIPVEMQGLQQEIANRGQEIGVINATPGLQNQQQRTNIIQQQY